MNVNTEKLNLTAKSKGMLAEEYDVSVKTLTSWFKDAGLVTGRRKKLNSKEVRFVYEKFGVPRQDVPIKSLIR